jgi:2-alkyl-3-oxoalkanoate reductase
MKALVTGAGGFLGSAIVRGLLKQGAEVRGFSRGRYPALEKLGVELHQGDIADGDAVSRAVKGMDVVFHVAAKVGLWGDYEDFRKANVEGTRRVISACQDHQVPKLVFTGSPSVVFDGSDVEGWDESAPYPARFDSCYSRTKAASEDMVLAADGLKGVATVSLRPHLVWGPGENHIVSKILEKARSGKLRRIGALDKLVDTTYIDDAADAHLLAAARLGLKPSIGGKAYFISQGDPRPIWEIVNRILGAAGLPPVTESVPPLAAKTAAAAMEAAWKVFRLPGEPRLTRFLVSQLSTAHWFDISAARRDLGYAPKVTIEEGFERLRVWFQSEGTAVPGTKVN